MMTVRMSKKRDDTPGDKLVSIRLTADSWRWIHGVLDGQLDAGACKGGNYPAESDALLQACMQIVKKINGLHPTNHPRR